MQRRNDESTDEPPLTRSDYRRQKEQEQEAFRERDKKRVQVEKAYARQHGTPDETLTDDDVLPLSTSEQKTKRLGRRLNWAILWLSLGIIAVYLILFFVEL